MFPYEKIRLLMRCVERAVGNVDGEFSIRILQASNVT
jgi:hypothetical protein